MKLLFATGVTGGWRGEEHVKAETSHISHGTFPENTPLENYRWYSISIQQDKTCSLSVFQSHPREDTYSTKWPVLGLGKNSDDMGGCLERYLDKMGPGQYKLYCRPMTKEKKEQYVKEGGNPEVVYDGSKPLSVAEINKLFKKGAAILGLKVRTNLQLKHIAFFQNNVSELYLLRTH